MDKTSNRTIAMIKPCAMARGCAEDLRADILEAGYRIIERRTMTLSRDQAAALYAEHSGRDHFEDLVAFTASGPVKVLHLESGEPDAAEAFRAVMTQTLRPRYATGIRTNAIHGSDSASAYKRESVIFGLVPALDAAEKS